MRNLIVFRGPTGVGKTTLANALGKELQIPVIDKDDVKDIIDASFSDSRVAGALSYEAMWRIAGRQLMNGLSVICDSPLGIGTLGYQRALETAARFQAKLTIVDCVCSEEDTWRARVELRATDPSHPKHKASTWEEARSLSKDFVGLEAEQAITIDISGALDAALQQILFALGDRLKRPGPGLASHP